MLGMESAVLREGALRGLLLLVYPRKFFSTLRLFNNQDTMINEYFRLSQPKIEALVYSSSTNGQFD